MTVWDLQETRTLVRARHGREQLEIARLSLGSTIDRREYARYHYHEAMELFDSHIGELHSSQRLFTVILGGNDEDEQDEFHQHLDRIGAHVTACVQSLHAIADIFAHAIYYSLGYNLLPSALSERQISLVPVKKMLSSKREHVGLAKALGSLSSHSDFKYLSALANHGKHRSLVRPKLWLHMTDKAPDPYTLQFQQFTYDGKPYAQRDIRPFLQSEFNRISVIVVETGNELNAALRATPL